MADFNFTFNGLKEGRVDLIAVNKELKKLGSSTGQYTYNVHANYDLNKQVIEGTPQFKGAKQPTAPKAPPTPKAPKGFPKDTGYVDSDTSGWWGPFKAIGKWIRSLHIYGVDPLTRGFAKLGGTILGSFIHPVTLAITACMFLYKQIRKVIMTNDDWIKKNNNVIQSINHKIEKIEKQKKAFDQIIDKVKQLQQENTKLNATEQQLIKTYAHKLQQQGLISKDVKFDSQGRITNIDELTEQAYDNAGAQLLQQLIKKDERLASNMQNAFDKLFGWTDKQKEFFANGRYDPNMKVEDLLPWLQKATKAQVAEAKKRLDISKLYSGSLQLQKEFLEDLRDYLKDSGRGESVEEVLNFLQQRLDIKDQISGIKNGINKTEDQMKALSKGFKQLTESRKRIEDKNTAHNKAMSDLREQERTKDMNARERAEDEEKKAIKASMQASKAKKQINERQAKLAAKGWIKDQNGDVTNVILQNMLNRNPKLRQFEKQLKQNQKAQADLIKQQVGGAYEYVNNPYNLRREEFLSHKAKQYWTEDQREFQKMMRSQRLVVQNAEKNVRKMYGDKNQKIYDQIRQILGENADTYLTLREQTADAKQNLKQIEELTETATTKQEQALRSKIAAAQFDKQAAQEEAQKKKTQQDFWKNIINPQLQSTFKNSNAYAASRFNELLQQLQETKGRQNITGEDVERLKKASQLEDINRKIQDTLSKQQYTIKNDQFARKGGGYGFYVEQLNPIRNVENLEKEQVQLLKELVASSRANGEAWGSWITFR